MSLPALRSLLVIAATLVFVIPIDADEPARLAHFRFDGKTIDLSKGKVSLELPNAEFKDKALYINGVYDYDGKQKKVLCKTPALNYAEFTVAIRFKPEEFGGTLFTGGTDYRWFGMRKFPGDNLIITLNNAAFSHQIKDVTLAKGEWADVACSVSLAQRKVLVFFNGKKAADIELPKDFEMKVIKLDPKGSDKVWSFSDYASGLTFHGLVSEIIIFGKALGEEELGKVRLNAANDVAAGDVAASDDDVALLPQGPVHEAFAHPVELRPQPRPQTKEQPPEDLEETPPSDKPKGDNVMWIPGYWSWDEDRANYIWVSGLWRRQPPGRQWLPGAWQQKGKVWQRAAGLWVAEGQSELQFLPAPPRLLDISPPTPPKAGDNSTFVPGIWIYREGRFRWRPGFWLAHRPDWVWMPAHYVWSPAGYLFSEGYWDYPLAERGLLFAPLLWKSPSTQSAGSSFAPRFVLNPDYVLSALFTRRGMGGYYFGDYFGARYEKGGFVTWMDYHPAKYSYDPLFAYYRAMHLDDRNWDRDLRAMYQGRMNAAARPALKWIDRTGAIIDPKLKETAMVAFTQLDKIDRKLNDLENLPSEKLGALRDAAKQSQGLSVRRQELEANLLDSKPGAIEPKDKSRVVKFEMSGAMSQVKGTAKPPPSSPSMPKHEDRPYASQEDLKPLDLMSPLTGKDASTAGSKTATRAKGSEVKGSVITKTQPAKAKPPSKPVKP
jgi:hypothetical protein